MEVSLAEVAAVAAPLIGGLTWLIRLEGRINVTDARFVDIISRLARIEAKQDDRH